jgi:hypothetical protein
MKKLPEVTLYVDEENTLRWGSERSPFRDKDGVVDDTANITSAFYEYDRDSDGEVGDVIAGSQLGMVNVASGIYECTTPSSLPIVSGSFYWWIAIANGGQGRRKVLCVARDHGRE